MGFYAFGTRFQSRFFARKDVSWRARKANAKTKSFSDSHDFFLLFYSAYLLDIMSPVCSRRFWQSTFSTDPWLSWADPEGGQGVRTPPEKSQKNRVSKQY